MNIRSLLFLLIAIFIFAACSRTETVVVRDQAQTASTATPSEDSPAVQDPITLTIGEIEKVYSFDPLFALNAASKRIAGLVYDRLVNLDEDENIVPMLAESWEVSDDSLEYVFKLRNDAFFHDDDVFAAGRGRRVTASDVKLMFIRMAGHDVPRYGAEMFLDSIVGFDAFHRQENFTFFTEEAVLDEISGIYVIDDRTISFELYEPDDAFLRNLASPLASVYPYEVFRERATGLHQEPVGSGRFMFDYATADSIISLQRNFNYFDQESISRNLTSIELRIIRDESRLFRNLVTNTIDLIPEAGPLTMRTLVDSSGENLAPGYAGDYRLYHTGNSSVYMFLPGHDAELHPDLSEIFKSEPFLNTFPQSAQITIFDEFNSDRESDSELNNEHFRIGFSPSPLSRYAAQSFGTIFKNSSEITPRLYLARSSNRDFDMLFSDGTMFKHGDFTKFGTMQLNRTGVSRNALHGLKMNSSGWWISFESLDIQS